MKSDVGRAEELPDGDGGVVVGGVVVGGVVVGGVVVGGGGSTYSYSAWSLIHWP